MAAQARDLEKRFNNVADVFSHAGDAFTSAGETLTKSVTAPLVAVGTAAIKFSSDSHDAFQQFAAATGTATDEMGKYKDMTLILPPMELQKQFSDFVKQVDKSKVAIQKSLDETQLLFDSLMQKYFG